MAPDFVSAERQLRLRFIWHKWAVFTLMGTLAALTVLPAVWTQYQQMLLG